MKSTKANIAVVSVLFLVAGMFWVRAVRQAQNTRTLEDGIAAQWAGLGSDHNGFDVSNAIIPRAEIRAGGPPRDGIPSIDKPKFAAASSAGFLADQDEIVGLNIGGESKAYPLRILVWHEIVNDQIGGTAVISRITKKLNEKSNHRQ